MVKVPNRPTVLVVDYNDTRLATVCSILRRNKFDVEDFEVFGGSDDRKLPPVKRRFVRLVAEGKEVILLSSSLIGYYLVAAKYTAKANTACVIFSENTGHGANRDLLRQENPKAVLYSFDAEMLINEKNALIKAIEKARKNVKGLEPAAR